MPYGDPNNQPGTKSKPRRRWYDLHHTVPIFMGGDPKQQLVQIKYRDHRVLHSQMSRYAYRTNKFLDVYFKSHRSFLSMGNKNSLKEIARYRVGRKEIVKHLNYFYIGNQVVLSYSSFMPIFFKVGREFVSGKTGIGDMLN